MALIERNAHLRDRKIRAYLIRIGQWVHCILTTRRPHHIRDLPPHLARDAGLSETDLAPHQHRLPSQHTHHPRG